LEAGGQCRKIILTPGSRFRYSPCCLTKGHCSNLNERNYGKWMEEKLSELMSTVCDNVRMRNIKPATVMELGQLIMPSAGQSEYLHKEEIWGEDPVHMTRKGYKLAATGIESLIYEMRSEEKEAEENGWPEACQEAEVGSGTKQALVGLWKCFGGCEDGWERPDEASSTLQQMESQVTPIWRGRTRRCALHCEWPQFLRGLRFCQGLRHREGTGSG